jgi:hypothetical protein
MLKCTELISTVGIDEGRRAEKRRVDFLFGSVTNYFEDSYSIDVIPGL